MPNRGTHTYSYLVRAMLLLILCAWGLVGNAQKFSKLYYDGRPSMLFGSVDYNNGTYYTTGVTNRKFSPYYMKSFFGRIYEDGVLDTTVVFNDTNSYSNENFMNALQRSSDGNYIFVGSVYDTISKAYMAKVDTAGNLLLYKEYPIASSDFVKGQDIVEIPGSGYLIVINVSYLDGNSDVYIISTDTSGEITTSHNYSLNGEEWPWVIRPMMNGHFLVGAFSMKTNFNTPFWCKTWLLEVDSMGNKVNEWIDSDMTNLWPYSMQQTADSGWIVVRQHLAYDNQYQAFNASVLKLDKNYNEQWERHLGDSSDVTTFYDIEILPDGKYIACGITPIWGHDSAYRWGWIVKLDIDGDVIWDKKYTAANKYLTFSFLYDIDILPNGDLIACGEKSGNAPLPQQQAWLLRTDSNGCEIENCVVGVEDIAPTTAVNVYPNPFTDEVHISIDNAVLYDAVITVSNPLGQVVQQLSHVSINGTYTLNLSDAPRGVFYISVATNGECLVRTVVKN